MALADLVEVDPFAFLRCFCPICNKYTPEILTPEDEIICEICACVKERVMHLDVPMEFCDDNNNISHSYAKDFEQCTTFVPTRTRRSTRSLRGKSTYNRVFHLNEIMAQLSCKSPVVPDELLLLIMEEVKSRQYGNPENFGFAHIRKICR